MFSFLKSLSFKIRGVFTELKDSFNTTKQKGFPKISQWKFFFLVLSKKERLIFFSFFAIFLGSFLSVYLNFYYQHTNVEPSQGGHYTEGIIGRPRFINPIYASSNDADRDLTELLFSGLMKYDSEGKIVPDMAESYTIQEDGKIYDFVLKNDIYWHDGKKFSVDDIIFTIKTIQNPDYKSPVRTNWLGVETEKIDEKTIRFFLKNPYSAFLENTTQKFLPKHIWENIPSQNFPLADYNLQPIGNGFYRFKNLSKDQLGYIKSFTINIAPRYFDKKPYISEITFKYFNSENDSISAIKKGEVQGLSFISSSDYKSINNSSFNIYRISLPRYFSLFFNQEGSKLLADKNIRQALNYATNKEELVSKILLGEGLIVESPILPNFFGFNAPKKVYTFNPELARTTLEKAGFKDENNDGFREKTVENPQNKVFKSVLQLGIQGTEVKELQKCLAKDPDIYPEGEITGVFGEKTKKAVILFQEKYKSELLTPSGLSSGTGKVGIATIKKLNELCGKPLKETTALKFTITTVEQPQLIQAANIIKSQWENLGIKVEINALDASKLQQDFIKPRAYEILLFGEVLGSIPDPFSFWHSSQKRDPGLNLAAYENKEVDKLLEASRQTQNEETRKQNYEKFQELLIADAPAVFLYSPDYLYPVSQLIKGINIKFITDPSKRFSNITNWYINSKRSWK